MSKNTIYASWNEAVAAEIVTPIEASGVVADAYEEFDVDQIAEGVLGYASVKGRQGWRVARGVDHDRFWEIVMNCVVTS